LRLGVVGSVVHDAARGRTWVSVTDDVSTLKDELGPQLSADARDALDYWLVVHGRSLVSVGSRGHRSAHRAAAVAPGERRTGDLLWDTVVSVEYVGEKECFDFQMANGERPYALVEDFLAHNCGKKNRALIQKEREKFVAGTEATGYGADLG